MQVRVRTQSGDLLRFTLDMLSIKIMANVTHTHNKPFKFGLLPFRTGN